MAALGGGNTAGGAGGSGAAGGNNNNNGGGAATVATVSPDPYAGMLQVEQSNGGEYHRYSLSVGVSKELKEHFQMAFNDETFKIMADDDYGVVLEDPQQPGVPFTPGFTPSQKWGEDGPPGEADAEHKKRMKELEDVGFAKGFALGLGYGGYDMVKSTGELIVGTAKFVGRAHLQVGLRFKWAFNWATGQDNTQTNEWLTEVDNAQGAVIDQGLAVGKFLGSLLVDTAAIFPKIQVGLLTGDVELLKTALHGSETHQKIFMMAAEVLTQTSKDLGGTPGQQGYVVGKIVFEVASFLLPYTKAGKLMQATKGKLLERLIGKSNVLTDGASAVATRKKAVCEGPFGCFLAGEKVVTQSQTGFTNIEDIHRGDIVWSRDEDDPTQSGWRQVTAVQVTHPLELYHLTYEVRDHPRNSSPKGSQSLPSYAHVSGIETLKVTGEHPFWVERGESGAFVSVKDLRCNDVFACADGGSAVVTHLRVEHAPKGQTFTTYNFTVEEFHTYFVGSSGIWVHNAYPKVPIKQQVATLTDDLAELAGKHIDDLGKDRFPLLAKQRDAYLKSGGKISDPAWMDHGKINSDKILDDFVNKVITDVDDVPSFKKWDTEFYMRPEGFRYGKDTPPKGMLKRGDKQLHHIGPQKLTEILKDKGFLPLDFDPHSVPGMIMETVDHQTMNKTGASLDWVGKR